MPTTTKKKTHRSSRSTSRTQRPSTSLQKTEILINVYDLLPPGKISSTLWFLGSSLLHTGVVIKALNHEYAFGGHDRANLSGVYWTKPQLEPPGGTWRCEILSGFTFRSATEIEEIVKELSGEFLGPSYNLLENNCNHFTNCLVKRLTGRVAPGWLNRAASIGVALPCVVPREWISPPEFEEGVEGSLVDGGGEGEEEEEGDERTAMLREEYWQRRVRGFHEAGDLPTGEEDEGWDSERDRRRGGSGKGKERDWDVLRDTDGRGIPASERAPLR